MQQQANTDPSWWDKYPNELTAIEEAKTKLATIRHCRSEMDLWFMPLAWPAEESTHKIADSGFQASRNVLIRLVDRLEETEQELLKYLGSDPDANGTKYKVVPCPEAETQIATFKPGTRRIHSGEILELDETNGLPRGRYRFIQKIESE